jgi:hypothetical protein
MRNVCVKNSLFSLISRPVLTYLSMVLSSTICESCRNIFPWDLYPCIYAYPLCVGPVSIHEHARISSLQAFSIYIWQIMYLMSPIPCSPSLHESYSMWSINTLVLFHVIPHYTWVFFHVDSHYLNFITNDPSLHESSSMWTIITLVLFYRTITTWVVFIVKSPFRSSIPYAPPWVLFHVTITTWFLLHVNSQCVSFIPFEQDGSTMHQYFQWIVYL